MGRSVPRASKSNLRASNSKLTERTSVPSPLAVSSSSATEKVGFLQRIIEFDKQLSLRVHGGGLVVPRWVLKFLEFSGDGLWSIPLTAALWLAPIFLDKDELRSFLFNLFVAFIFDLACIGVIKGIIRRPRPVYNKGMYLVLSVDHYSFPSGHSSRALMIAAFSWLNLPIWENLLATRPHIWEGMLQNVGFGIQGYVPSFEMCLAIALWSWALATAASRILLGRHYVLDVLVGTLVGILEAMFVHRVLFVPKDVSHRIHNYVLGVSKQSLGFNN